MPVISTVKAPEQWLIEVNGSYDICFKAVTLAADVVDGEVIIVGGKTIGIASGAGLTGETIRVMVRGNPSSVAAAQLTGVTTGLDKSIVLV